ncbi:conserved hypothetical protein [Anaeromyxobacter dehalogenans 2CP-1]|uniref:Urease accessory protein UreH-like transmembrane domain-containing protein n=1 Tax=Anaeromyxobacter dehalogenans (strain ATCC BAA-258 / DSM 21875 / 2CP-1) TaxID=455488 RepID=B8JA08_ANAD2|nr:sulfite exporter TauE/SafE family protein [Anaeromyxobacter dehalogenans]ACL63711.1 conserved hypothetical protein [Anaeromyxobacter dehalogenans 2CP-1]
MTLLGPLSSGFLLGLGTGPLCFIGCIPLALPFALPGPDAGPGSRRGGWGFLLKFLAGRLVAYSTVGVLTGLASSLAGPLRRWVTPVWLALSLVLILHGLGRGLGHRGLCGATTRLVRSRAFPFLLGLAAALSVCPPFLLAVAYAMDRSGQVLGGVAFFLAFFVATTLYVLPIAMLGYLPRRELWQRVGRVASVIAGAALLAQGLRELLA